MNPNSIFQNGLPQELKDIPAGQIFILIRPSGITLRNSQMASCIWRIAMWFHKELILHVLQVENPKLWNYAVYKVEQGDKFVFANEHSLLEMLCELWGLDMDDMSEYIGRPLKDRLGAGKEHPARVPSYDEPNNNDNDDLMLGCLQVPEKTDVIERVRSSFKDNFSYGLGASIQEISNLYEYERTHKRTYTLDIQIDKGKYNGRYYKRFGKCEISLIDNYGTRYPIPLDAKAKVIYLTYIMLKDGIEYTQIGASDEFYSIYSQIHNKMPRASGIPLRWNLEKKEQLDTYTNYISKIRKTIYNAVGEYKPVELFAVEGGRKEVYKVQGASDEHRKLIREAFELK